jgi:SAM-dependent methyltransferase
MSQQKQLYDCVICQSSQYQTLFEPWQEITDPAALYGAASGIRGTQHIVKCHGCGLIYENPRYDEQTILEGYINTNEAEHDSQYPMRVKSFYKSLRSLEKKGIPPKGAKVLDIGTAGGAFIEAARQYGYDVYGLEPSKFLVEQGEQSML